MKADNEAMCDLEQGIFVIITAIQTIFHDTEIRFNLRVSVY